MSRQDDSTTPLSVALCVEGEALARLGPVLSHLVVGLVEQAVSLRLVSSDPKAQRLKLGPVQTLIHPKIAWPFTEQRIDFVLSELQGSTPTVTHAIAHESYRKAWAVADAFDTDLVITVTSIRDIEHLADYEIGRPQRFVALSEPLGALLRDPLKIPQDRVVCVRPGVNAKGRVSCFQKEGRSATVMCTAPLEKQTGVDLLIEAVYQLKREERDLMLFLLGRGRRESWLRKLVLDRGLASSVTFANPQGDIADVMEGADLFVHLPEEAALTIDGLRSMGAGMAVVAFEDAVCDHFHHERTALVCRERTADALAKAMRRLIDDHAMAKALANRSIEYVQSHHSMSGMAEATATIYRQLALNRATFSLKE
ncbi:MAG: glycosyltransferase family 4 protein [Phycisphaerae bacterium]